MDTAVGSYWKSYYSPIRPSVSTMAKLGQLISA